MSITLEDWIDFFPRGATPTKEQERAINFLLLRLLEGDINIRSIRSTDDYAVTYFLDARFPLWYRQYHHLFPGWFRDAITELKNPPLPP